MLKNLPMQIEELVEKKKMKSNKIPKVETQASAMQTKRHYVDSQV